MDNNKVLVLLLTAVFLSAGFGYMFGFGIGQEQGYDWGYAAGHQVICKSVNGTAVCPVGEDIILGEIRINCNGDSRQTIEFFDTNDYGEERSIKKWSGHNASWWYNNGNGRSYNPLDECGMIYNNGTMETIDCDVLEVENDGM